MKTESENLMTQYLLGNLSEDEKLRMEEQFFTDDEAFAQLMAMEDELRYDYARGGLSDAQRRQFEQRFLSLPGESQRVALAQAVLHTVAEANLPKATEQKVVEEERRGFFQWFSTLFGMQNPGMQFVMTAATVLLLLGGAFLLYLTLRMQNGFKEVEVAHQREKEATEQLIAGQRDLQKTLSDELEKERRQRTELEQKLTRQKAEAARANENSTAAPATFLSFLLTPGLSRDIDSTKRLTIPATARQVRLQLTLKRPGNYQSYQAVLQTLDGANLWSRNLPSGRAVKVTVPANLLPPGDYVVLLKGKTADGQLEEIDEYHFNTVRP